MPSYKAMSLKPCPHCPRSICEPIQSPISQRWQVFCGACGSSSGSCKTEAEAIQLWDTRTSDEALTENQRVLAVAEKALGAFYSNMNGEDYLINHTGPALAEITKLKNKES